MGGAVRPLRDQRPRRRTGRPPRPTTPDSESSAVPPLRASRPCFRRSDGGHCTWPRREKPARRRYSDWATFTYPGFIVFPFIRYFPLDLLLTTVVSSFQDLPSFAITSRLVTGRKHITALAAAGTSRTMRHGRLPSVSVGADKPVASALDHQQFTGHMVLLVGSQQLLGKFQRQE